MYSKKRIAERLELVEKEFHFVPEYHSISDIEEFERHLDRKGMYIYDHAGNPCGTQNLTQFEHDWIQNEQLLVMNDAEYALTRYFWIKDEKNIIRRFAFRVPQRIFFNIISDLEEMHRTLEFVILKARQLGCSTLVELLIGLRIIFGFGVNAIIASADTTKTQLMAGILFLMYDYLPIWMRPQYTRRVESERGMLVFGQSKSGVSFQHGTQMSGIARGTTPTIYHLSEVASFTDPINQIESSLFRAVHPSPSVFGALESSGEGDKGYWPDKWRSSRDGWANHQARHCPLFLPWYCGIEMYPNHQWITYDNPISSYWMPTHETREHKAKCELYVQGHPLLEKHLIAEQKKRGQYRGGKWELPREQQWFWEFGHEEAKRNGTEDKWFQEMCADDDEALQRSTTSAFSPTVIKRIDESREKTYDIFALVGQSIEADHEPSEEYIDYTRERIPIRYKNMRDESFRWELVPVSFDPPLRENQTEDAIGKVFIWHHPQPGVRYSIGVDTSGGMGYDSTCISVWAVGVTGEPDVQVAEFTSPYVSHVESFAFVMGLAAYYKTHMSYETTQWKEPYVSIEQLRAVGDVAQQQMSKMGYNNFHIFARIDGKNPAEDKRRSRRRGWYTNSWSREVLTGNFVQWAKNQWIKINSPWLIEECKTFENKVTATGKVRQEHEDGYYDDRIFAAGMAVYCPHDSESMVHRSKKRIIEDEVLPKLDLRPYQPNTFSYKELQQTEIANVSDLLDDAYQLERFR